MLKLVESKLVMISYWFSAFKSLKRVIVTLSFAHTACIEHHFFLIGMSGTIRVISARFSKSGSPLVVLASRHAFLFDMGMKCWLRIADDCFPASNFASSFNLSSIHSGELGNLQVDVGKFISRKPTWTRFG